MNLDELIALKNQTQEPITVTHCGSSSKCQGRFQEASLADTINNKRVYSIGCNTKSDADLEVMGTHIDKIDLDILHLWKIDASSEVLILDVTDDDRFYIGESAKREWEYALRMEKRIRFYSQEHELEPCGNCGKATPTHEFASVGVIFVKDGESGTIEYCLACTDYLLDTPEGETVVLEVSGEPVTLAWQFYHQNV